MSEFIYQAGTPLGEAERTAWHEQRMAALRTEAAERQEAARVERERLARFHSVTVTTKLDDEGTPDESRRVDRVAFTCTAALDAGCRTYPVSCGCDSFEWEPGATHDTSGHLITSGNACWMQDWFDAGSAVYIGEGEDDRRDDYVPAIDRAGLIVVTFQLEWIEWDWFTPAPEAASDPDQLHPAWDQYGVGTAWGIADPTAGAGDPAGAESEQER